LFLADVPEIPKSEKIETPSSPALIGTEEKETKEESSRDLKGSVPSEMPTPEEFSQIVLTQNAGAVFYHDATPQIGSPLKFHHEYSLLQGQIEILSPRGARVIFDSPAVFRLRSEEQVFVSYGNCSVHAPEGSEGFEVLTPYTQFIDRGTRFVVNVDEHGESEVHVVEGIVDAVTSQDPGLKRLLQGEKRRYLRSGSEPLLATDSSLSSYRDNLPDRLVRYHGPENDQGGIERLESVTVMRGGQLYQYSFSDLIGGDVTSFCAQGRIPTVYFMLPEGNSGNREELFQHDDSFRTGVVNPGGSSNPFRGRVLTPAETDDRSQWTPGMTVTFREPVTNSPGPDILFFEAHSVIQPLQGDDFHIRPLELKPGYRPVTVTKYDLGMLSPEILPLNSFELLSARTAPGCLDDLLNVKMHVSESALNYRVIATGIDLSDMGVPEGESISAVFLQDTSDDFHRIDPVMIVGLPILNP
ncbi:MAG TPA: FecR domain-containing protein, partial [Planctomicrobium sp.]|nr:FecR domain-containing protein [Planctomicrobium sp.]